MLSEGPLDRLLCRDRVELRKILDAAADIDGAADIQPLPHETKVHAVA